MPVFLQTCIAALLDWLFGYDLFISYTRRDRLESYAAELARRLTLRGLVCFVDSTEFQTGLSWKRQGRRALQKSSKIVLLLSPSAEQSEGIRDELDFNASLRSRRPISVVQLSPKPVIEVSFVQLLERNGVDLSEQLWIPESSTATETGLPSDGVVARIESDFRLRRQVAKRLAILAVATVLFGCAAVVTLVLYRRERAALQAAEISIADSFVFQSRNEANASRWSSSADLLQRSIDKYKSAGISSPLADFGAWLLARQVRRPVAWLNLAPSRPSAVTFAFGGTVAIANESGEMIFWNPGNSNMVRVPAHDGRVRVLCPRDGAGTLYSGGLDGTVREWFAAGTNRQVVVFEPKCGISAMDAPAGWLCAGLYDGVVKILRTDAPASDPVVLKAHSGDVTGVGLFPEEGRLVTCSRDNQIHFWQLVEQHWERVASRRQTGPLTGLSRLAGTSWVLVSSASGEIHVYDSAGNQKREANHPADLAIAIAARDDIGLSAHEAGIVKLWDLATGAPMAELWGHTNQVRAVAITDDATRLVTASVDGGVGFWSRDFGGMQALGDRHSPAQPCLLAAGRDVIFRLSDRQLAAFSYTGTPLGSIDMDGTSVAAVAAAPDDRGLAVVTEKGAVRVLAWPGLHPIAELGNAAATGPLAVGPGAKMVAWIDQAGGVQVHDDTGTWKAPLTPTALTLGLAENGAWLAVGTVDRAIHRLDMASRRSDLIADPRPAPAITALSLSPDGSVCAEADESGDIRVHQPGRSKPLLFGGTSGRPRAPVLALHCFRQPYVLAVFDTFDFSLWELPYERRLEAVHDTIYPGFNSKLRHAVISSDGRTMVVETQDGHVLRISPRHSVSQFPGGE